MSYIEIRPDTTLGSAGCGCGQRRRHGRSAYLGQAAPAVKTVAPVFQLDCPDGCGALTAGQCQVILRQVIAEAIRLVNGAASKVEVATKVEPGLRDADARETARLFRFFFGHDPRRPVEWAGNQASGASVARRYRMVARELGGGRRFIFRCLPSRADCGDDDITCCGNNENARASQALAPNVVLICPGFWDPPAGLRGLPPLDFRAGVVLHEVLHLLYAEFLGDAPPGRPNAHCYEAFAMRINGFGADRDDVDQCRN